MTTVLYLCPRTGLKVQGLIAEEPAAGATSVSVDCPICNSIHLVNPLSAQRQSNPSGTTNSRATAQAGDEAGGSMAAQIAMLGAAVVILLMILWLYVR